MGFGAATDEKRCVSSLGVEAAGVERAGVAVAGVDEAFGVLARVLDGMGPRAVVAAVGRFRCKLDALEARALSAGVSGDSTKLAHRFVADAPMTAHERRRRVNRAKAVAANPGLGDLMDSGSLVGEQLDAIAWASNRSNGEAATDTALIGTVESASVDQARRVVEQWVAGRTTAAEAEREHARQRSLRIARRTTSRDGLGSISLAGDNVTIDEMWAEIEALANTYWRDDGGRETPCGQHHRTTGQRYFDAAATILTGRDSDRRGGSRPRIVLVAQTDTDPRVEPPRAIGIGPVPASVLEQYWCDADLVGALFDGDGRPLRVGRTVRTATDAQIDALLVRDQGCVICGASHRHCQAHHIVPFGAPAKGRTDIDNLALLCQSCHSQTHANHQTLQPPTVAGGQWSTRAARPPEIAPAGPTQRAGPTKRHHHNNGATSPPTRSVPNHTAVVTRPDPTLRSPVGIDGSCGFSKDDDGFAMVVEPP